jgi:predicted  nucleic acid-binding Zn-ribbon protein
MGLWWVLCAAVSADAVARFSNETGNGTSETTTPTTTISSPVDKVIELISELQQQVENEGLAEAKTYNEYACFCQSSHDAKVRSITELAAAQSSLSAEFAALSASRQQMRSDVATLQGEIAVLEEEIANATKVREAEKRHFDGVDAQMKESLSQIDGAIKDIKAGTGGAGGGHGEAAEVNGVPTTDYGGEGSKEKTDTLEALYQTFFSKHEAVVTEEMATKKAFELVRQAKQQMIDEKAEAIRTQEEMIGETTAHMGKVQADLTRTTSELNDDRAYLAGLTMNCEVKGKEWDQRVEMRSSELQALTQALVILESSVAAKASNTGEGGRSGTSTVHSSLNFVQVEEVKRAKRVKVAKVQAEFRPDPLQDAAASLLAKASHRIGSAQLAALSEQVNARWTGGGSAFDKVKGMVQDLITKLKEEEAQDATHQTWCVEETAKSTKDREYRLHELNKLDSHQRELQAQKAALDDQIENLENQLAESRKDLGEANSLRTGESADNTHIIAEAEAGKEAVEQALTTLEEFYGMAANSTVEGLNATNETNLTYGEVDDAPDAFSGAYKGSQGASTGIIGMLEVVVGDFQRTVSTTMDAEATAVREFKTLERELQAAISTKDHALTAAENELDTTEDDITTGTTEINQGQKLLDAAVKSVMEMDASCKAGGTGEGGAGSALTWEEREGKRQAEIQALKDAMCIFGDCEGEQSPQEALAKGEGIPLGFLQR